MGDHRRGHGREQRADRWVPEGPTGPDPRADGFRRDPGPEWRELTGSSLRGGHRADVLTSGIILAAGSSIRLGRPKQLLDLGGKPVLQHVVDAALSSPLDEIVLVLGHAAREIADAVPPRGRVRVALNPDHGLGQSTSLRVGLRAADAGSQAAVFLLGDQPGIRVDAIAAVLSVWRETAPMAVQAAYRGRPAHPTLFDRRVWPELREATGDEGARAILARHPEWRALAEVGGHTPDDIDTEADYERVRSAFETGQAD